MKKLILLFAFLFTVSGTFMSCRDTTNRDTDVELNDDIDDAVDDTGDALDEAGDDIEDGVDDLGDEVDEEF